MVVNVAPPVYVADIYEGVVSPARETRHFRSWIVMQLNPDSGDSEFGGCSCKMPTNAGAPTCSCIEMQLNALAGGCTCKLLHTQLDPHSAESELG